MIDSIVNRIKKRYFDLQEFLCFKLTHKDSESIFFYPHPNCKTDQYDIIRYHSDNVLCLINYIIKHSEYSNYNLFLVVYDITRIEEYWKYVTAINNKTRITFIDGSDKLAVKKAASSCSLLFTATGGTYFKYRTHDQKVVCLNYFIPFKDDYIRDKKHRAETQIRNNTFDNFVLTAYIPCLISSVVRSFPLEQFLTLGFCRNDVFYSQDFSIKKDLSHFLGFEVKKYLIFTPTYRDYEYNLSSFVERDLFGYNDVNYFLLDSFLSESSTVIIAKLHPLQTNINVSQKGNSHIVMFSDLKELNYSLYQYLSEADGLITDYTSTYFDFLHRNKPVIFNFYDFNRYNKERGFALNPIRPFCAGDQVENSEDLIKAIIEIIEGHDKYKEQRMRVAPLFDDYYDGNNTKRVCEYFLKTDGNRIK